MHDPQSTLSLQSSESMPEPLTPRARRRLPLLVEHEPAAERGEVAGVAEAPAELPGSEVVTSLARGIGLRRMTWMLAAVARNERARRLGQPVMPYKLELMTTFACDSRCKTCLIWSRYLQEPDERSRELPPEVFGRIAASVRESVRWVSFTGGEVTDRPDFVDIVRSVVDAVGDRLALINITTNGLRPDRTRRVFAEVARVTRGIPTFVTVSLDGTKDTYTTVRGVPGYDAVRASMRELRELKQREPHLRTGYEATISALNAHDVDPLFDVMTAEGDRPTFTQASNALQLTRGRIDVDVRKQGPAVRSALERAFQRMRVRSPLDLAPKLYLALVRRWFAKGEAPLPCSGGHATLTVDPYGGVLQCNTRANALVDLHRFGFDLAAAVRSADFTAALAPTVGCRDCWTPCHAYPTLLHHPVQLGIEAARALVSGPVTRTDRDRAAQVQ